ncbi:MAG: SecD/SecF family protein translocase subunit [Acidimicrobiales bacterium]
MARGQKLSALFVVLLAVAGAIYTVASGNKPLLGLDLQGGVSVVLQPTTKVDSEALDQSVEILRSRVDALGVAEPEIARQGDTIVVDLPGIKEQAEPWLSWARRPSCGSALVLYDLGSLDALNNATSGTDVAPGDSTPATDTAGGSDTTVAPGSGITVGGADTTAPAAGSTTTGSDTGSSEQGLGFNGRFGALVPTQDTTTATTTAGDTTPTTAAGDTTPTTAADDATTAGSDPAGTDVPLQQGTLGPDQLAIIEACGQGEPTAPEADAADKPVLLLDRDDNMLCLGPTLLTGDAVETAGATLDQAGQWVVNPVFKSGANGIDLFNQAAQKCYAANPDPNVCPAGRLAIVLDHEVVSAPTIREATFGRDQIVISGTFTEDDAKDLASVLRFGALPVELQTQQVRTVSATIGTDVLRAGVIAGLIGLALVALYLLLYYRLAALITITGLGLSAVMIWTVISYFGAERGLALTLGGVVGLIVSIGIAADSSIVYFENVKEAYQSGRKINSAVERAYKSAFSTVIKADFVSLIAAVLLYFLTVGAVRGFAFYLGLATLFDLLNAWLFMRPALTFLARRKSLANRPDLLLGVRKTAGATA